MAEHDPVKLEIFLDDSPQPVAIERPPYTFELDTTKLTDGPHKLFIKAYDRTGVMGIREIHFIVRNGPGIAVVGLTGGDIVEGRIPVLINAYSGTHDIHWEPSRAETPAPVPTWAWVLFLLVVVWAGYYWFDAGFPPREYASSPTFSSASVIAAAAREGTEAGGVPSGQEFEWAELGSKVYASRCQVCHAASGEGIARFVPTLRASPMVLANDPAEELRKILAGSGPAPAAKWKATMSPFAEVLTDEEIAAVANYERTSWGNAARTVRPEQVRAVREELRRR